MKVVVMPKGLPSNMNPLYYVVGEAIYLKRMLLFSGSLIPLWLKCNTDTRASFARSVRVCNMDSIS